MGLSSSISMADKRVRDAVASLSNANSELEASKRYGDEDRIKDSESKLNTSASALESAAKSLADAARRL